MKTAIASYSVHLWTHLVCLNGSILHVEIPDFDRQVVSGHHVAAVVTELHVWDRGDDFRKERAVAGVLRFFEH